MGELYLGDGDMGDGREIGLALGMGQENLVDDDAGDGNGMV